MRNNQKNFFSKKVSFPLITKKFFSTKKCRFLKYFTALKHESGNNTDFMLILWMSVEERIWD